MAGGSLIGVDPFGLDTVVLTVYDHGLGSHSAVRIDNGKDPVLYDPAGSYCRPKNEDPKQCAEPRGENDTFYGKKDTNLNDYIKFHKDMKSDGVRTLRFSTTPGEEAEIARRIDRLGGTSPLFCTESVSQALSGIGPFKGLGTYYLPGNLHDELRRRGGQK